LGILCSVNAMTAGEMANLPGRSIKTLDTILALMKYKQKMTGTDKFYAFPSLAYLAKETGRSIRTISRYLVRMVQLGWITMRRRYTPTFRYCSNIYNLGKAALNREPNTGPGPGPRPPIPAIAVSNPDWMGAMAPQANPDTNTKTANLLSWITGRAVTAAQIEEMKAQRPVEVSEKVEQIQRDSVHRTEMANYLVPAQPGITSKEEFARSANKLLTRAMARWIKDHPDDPICT